MNQNLENLEKHNQTLYDYPHSHLRFRALTFNNCYRMRKHLYSVEFVIGVLICILQRECGNAVARTYACM